MKKKKLTDGQKVLGLIDKKFKSLGKDLRGSHTKEDIAVIAKLVGELSTIKSSIEKSCFLYPSAAI